MDDSKIIDLFYERSEQAIIELSKKYGAVCTRVANNILNNRQDTEECVNDAYLGAWNTIPPHHPNPLLSYVCRIVRNLAVNRYHANTAAKRNSSYDVALDELENCFPWRAQSRMNSMPRRSPASLMTFLQRYLGKTASCLSAAIGTVSRLRILQRFFPSAAIKYRFGSSECGRS